MSIDDFQASLARYGPDISRWPDNDREAARALLDRSEYARQILQVDALLRQELGDKKIVAPKGLADRIVDQARRGSDDESSK